MAKKKSPFRNKNKKNAEPEINEADLDRFAGSSDEEDEPVVKQSRRSEPKVNHDADDEESSEEEEEEQEKASESSESDSDDDGEEDNKKKDRPFVTNAAADPEEEMDPGEKMAGAMARILGTAANKSTSVVLAKTTTPLQRLQQKEKAKQKELKEKRQANRERNLAALHIPLSVATSQPIGEGKSSIAKELEQERFHRRVATRGVVALFNAIQQHQHSTEDEEAAKSKLEPSKMTKHGFLDKIKSAAATIDNKKVEENVKAGTTTKRKEQPSTNKWDALKDDFMMKPKKNWDEESSEEEGSDVPDIQDISDDEDEGAGIKDSKRRKVAA
mmetsp:Transcript_41868/g.121013  ORF Transcript_41868/g.121013 Transcript_41868/m.121013 type:complete len:329 (-) Transcript_41868:129-1115(-)